MTVDAGTLTPNQIASRTAVTLAIQTVTTYVRPRAIRTRARLRIHGMDCSGPMNRTIAPVSAWIEKMIGVARCLISGATPAKNRTSEMPMASANAP